jgi:hypothetical protein
MEFQYMMSIWDCPMLSNCLWNLASSNKTIDGVYNSTQAICPYIGKFNVYILYKTYTI